MGFFDLFKKRKKINTSVNGKEYHAYVDCLKKATDKFYKNSQSESLTPIPNGCERVSIDAFLDKYIYGASIPEDLFIELQKRSLKGFTFADIPISTIELIKQKYEITKRRDEALQKCADLNNKGIAFEKAGDIDEAIKCYEENIADGCKGHHSYSRLVIIYRKQKKYDDEIRVINRAIEIFGDDEYYKKRLQKAMILKGKSEKM